jgi:Protein of unknown function (DUF4236)
MSVYFRKSFKVAPGVHINFSKRGTGVSFGGRGAHVSFSPTGRVTKTLSIPGTGIYYRDVDYLNSGSKKSTAIPHQSALQSESNEAENGTSHESNAPDANQIAAHQVVAVEHHGFYISHGFAAFALLLAGVLVANASQGQPRNIWALVLLIAGFGSLALWLKDLLHTKSESRNNHE